MSPANGGFSQSVMSARSEDNVILRGSSLVTAVCSYCCHIMIAWNRTHSTGPPRPLLVCPIVHLYSAGGRLIERYSTRLLHHRNHHNSHHHHHHKSWDHIHRLLSLSPSPCASYSHHTAPSSHTLDTYRQQPETRTHSPTVFFSRRGRDSCRILFQDRRGL